MRFVLVDVFGSEAVHCDDEELYYLSWAFSVLVTKYH